MLVLTSGDAGVGEICKQWSLIGGGVRGSGNINNAIRECVGYGVELSPVYDIGYIFDAYGESVGNEALSILDELNNVEIDWSENDLVQAAKLAVGTVCRKYPFIDEGSRMAMEWKFTFDWR